jgi:hypothetical protein
MTNQDNQNHVGKNALINRFHELNGTIDIETLNIDRFKIKCKKTYFLDSAIDIY